MQSLPAFIKEYKTDGASLYMNTGNPVKAVIIRSFMIEKEGENFTEKQHANNFWFAEGYLFEYEIDSEKYPTLSYYLANRGNAELAELWRIWCKIVDISEAPILTDAFLATRRNALETLADVPSEEKKSG